MILDIIILIILIFPMALGLRRGFVYTFVHTLGWIGALIAAIFLTDPLAGVMRDGFVGTAVSGTVYDVVYGYVETAGSLYDRLPGIMSGGLAAMTSGSADILVEMITNMVVSVMAFLIIVIAVKLVLRIVVRSMSAFDRQSVLSRGDRYLGLVAGALKGIIMVFLFLTLLVAVVNLSTGELAGALTEQLKHSVISGTLYDNNMLLLITGGLFS